MKKLLRNQVSLLFLLMLLGAPLGFAQSSGFSRSILLGDYYYPKGGARWIERNGKIEFKRGDWIIVQDSRVTLGRGAVQGPIPYALDDGNFPTGPIPPGIHEQIGNSGNENVNEFVTQHIFGASPGGSIQSEGHALPVLIDANSGTISAVYYYWDATARGLGVDRLLGTVDATNLATIVPDDSPGPGPTPALSVQASSEAVFAGKPFTLTGNLNAVSYTFQQTVSGLTGKAQVSQGSGISVDPATGILTLTGGRSVIFTAPDVAGAATQGTITFEVQATLAGNIKSNVVTKVISVLKEAAPPPPDGGSAGGTPVGTPQGNNVRADGYLPETNPTQAQVNVPFTLMAFGRDPDGTKISDPNIGVPGGANIDYITGKWERIPASGLPQPLSQKSVTPAPLGAYADFPLTRTESSAALYRYRFTITDAAGVGNYYETTVTVTTTPCTYSISPTSQSFTGAGGTGSFNVLTDTACPWTATADSPFITITSGASGAGAGTVSFSVTANPGNSSRSGKITAGGEVFTVTQASSCAYAISPQSQTFPASGGTGTITVSTDAACAWTATADSAFITITSGASGAGNGTVSFSVAANSATSDRTGKITIAGQVFTVTQASSCTYTISPQSQSFPAGGGTGTITVSTDAGCAWTATTESAFISIGSIIRTGTGGTGSGSVTFSVAPNQNGETRTGAIAVARHTFTVTQGETGILYFAMVGNGEGVVSDLVINNPSSTLAISGKIEFLDRNGVPLSLGLASEATAKSTADFALSPLGSVIVSTSGKGSLASGAARITADGAVGGIVRFTLSGAGVAGVSASVPLNGFVVPVRRKLGVNSSVALHNIETGPVSVTLTLLDKQGRQVEEGARTLDIVGGGQEALFLDELFPAANTVDFEGTLMVVATAGRKLAAVALEMGRQLGEFTVLPVIPLK